MRIHRARTIVSASFSRLSRRWLVAVAIAGASIFEGRSALGDGAVSEAQRLFSEGLQLAHAGECSPARDKFAQSYAADPAPGTLINWALCEEKLGRPATALGLLGLADARLAPGHPKLSLVKNHIASLRQRVPYLRIHPLRPLPAGTVVTKDTVHIDPSSMDENQPTDPGLHVIEVLAPGHESRRYEVVLDPGRTVDLAFEPGSPVPVPALRADTEGGKADHHVLGWVIGGTGLAAIGVGAVTGLLALSRWEDVRSDCNPETRLCKTDRGYEASASGRTLATVSTVAFAAGGVGLVGGVYFLLKSPTPATTSATTSLIVVTPMGQGIRVSYTF